MWTDFHLHVLPGIDDGAERENVSIKMLSILQQQQVDAVFATPHFYLHRQAVPDFVENRAKAYQTLSQNEQYAALPQVRLAAEVALEPGLSRQNCQPLCYEGLPAILLELPRAEYQPWIMEEIENIHYGFSVVPVLAHLERYLWYRPAVLRELLQIPEVIVQINAAAFATKDGMKLVKELYEADKPVLIGSDSHHCESRPPDFNIVNTVLQKRHYQVNHRFKSLASWLLDNQEWFLSK